MMTGHQVSIALVLALTAAAPECMAAGLAGMPELFDRDRFVASRAYAKPLGGFRVSQGGRWLLDLGHYAFVLFHRDVILGHHHVAQSPGRCLLRLGGEDLGAFRQLGLSDETERQGGLAELNILFLDTAPFHRGVDRLNLLLGHEALLDGEVARALEGPRCREPLQFLEKPLGLVLADELVQDGALQK
jgi:hypothetical protein